jgi:hypothetical protein
LNAPERGSTAGMRQSWFRALAAVAVVLLLVAACRTKRQRMIYRLESETRGWVVIVFNQPKAPPLPTQGDALLLDVPKSGLLFTSTKSPVGYARDKHLVRYPDGREVPLPLDDIQANSVGASTWEDGRLIEFEIFFLGTRAELEAAEKDDKALARARAALPR